MKPLVRDPVIKIKNVRGATNRDGMKLSGLITEEVVQVKVKVKEAARVFGTLCMWTLNSASIMSIVGQCNQRDGNFKKK